MSCEVPRAVEMTAMSAMRLRDGLCCARLTSLRVDSVRVT